MSASGPRLVIVEPCLEPSAPGAAGSHAGRFVSALLGVAGRRRCTIVARRGFVAGAGIADECAVHATLPFGPHSKVTAAGELDRLDERGRHRFRPELPWAAWHRQRRREERIEGFARGVLPALADLRAGDVVFVTTASELEAAGLARALARCSLPVGIGCHVLFHAAIERGFSTDRPRQVRRLERVRRLLAGAVHEAAPHRLAFHATTPELAAQYTRLGAAPCGVLPYPVVVPPPPPGKRSAAGPLRVAALGDARPEKNSHHLAGIVDAVAARPALAAAVTFAVQCNPGFAATSTVTGHEAVRRCLAALGDRPNVELVDGPLDDAAYVDQLHRADVALLAYDQDRYRTRLSAILLEALVAGAVPIVTGGGWMARQLAGAQADHVARITAGAVGQRLGLVRARTVRHPGLSMRCAVPAGTMALVVDVAWACDGTDALAEPPLRLACATDDDDDAPPLPTTVACAPSTGRTTAVLFPLRPVATPRTVTVHAGPVRAAAEVAIDRIAIDALAGAVPPPAGAAGVIVDHVADVPAALAEVARHADHYRHAAAALGNAVGAVHGPAALLERLVP
ncbi:MAG: hypothetical protein KGQ61_08895 [Planctomycetes bacterium]|nr:hypothetical protein [Planctomycetota bacterium]